ncbi:T9SS type A sorting domain-containing protein [Paracrocinitomix mangrovi]|uniref:T9SS type A sorting domain-containing protein n=1 Tax=Paracrocinitomix mangrovi TaxID=2862509 RepID=UPI001C8DFCD4|nr:T9SS type A sorting domain-containing protein [Paracrocinitomix mangrovi]UKN02769.1 T9SS type A sorting domain-containing protein [Paracrocinitomix mangrovi]
MISIPNPCNEDFDAMAPTKRGNYCTKCNTDTFDFRKLSDIEVYKILDAHQNEHICGQFENEQLRRIGANYSHWKNQTERTFQSKFLLACVFVFGLSLFSCDNEDKTVIENIQLTEMAENEEGVLTYINTDLSNETIDLLDYVGEVESVEMSEIFEVEEIICTTAGVVDVYQEEPLIVESYTRGVIAGMIAQTPRIITIVEGGTDTTEESTLAEPIVIDPDYFEAKAFPNPTTDNAQLAVEIDNEAQFDITLYNMNGQLVRNIHNGLLPSGRQLFDLQLSELNSGMYIVRVISGEQVETVKVQKVN